VSTLVEKIKPFAVMEPGERLLCAVYARATSGPTKGPAVVAVSDRRLLVAPRSAFMSASAWTRRRLRDARVLAPERGPLGIRDGRTIHVWDDYGDVLAFEFDRRKEARVVRAALSHGAPTLDRGSAGARPR
jgi:hypothetical protein